MAVIINEFELVTDREDPKSKDPKVPNGEPPRGGKPKMPSPKDLEDLERWRADRGLRTRAH